MPITLIISRLYLQTFCDLSLDTDYKLIIALTQAKHVRNPIRTYKSLIIALTQAKHVRNPIRTYKRLIIALTQAKHVRNP